MANISNSFIQQWGSEFAFKYQQKVSRLRASVWQVNAQAGSFSFPRMEATTAVLDKGRHADVTPANVDLDRVSATPRTIHWAEYLDDLDAIRDNADVRSAYTEMGVAAVNRQIDNLIITALQAGGTSLTSSLTSANKLDSGGLLAIAQAMNAADIDFDGRQAIISAGAINNIQSDAKFTSRDYVTSHLLETGNVPNVLGFNMSFTNLLPNPSGALKRNYFYHNMAVGLHILKDLTMRVDYIPQKDSWQVMVRAAVGATIVRPEAVFFADITG